MLAVRLKKSTCPKGTSAFAKRKIISLLSEINGFLAVSIIKMKRCIEG